jgi:Tfp pilus assembly protein PilX
MVTTLLIVLIFFILAVTISSVVTLQARSAMEEQLAAMSFYVADAGLRYATPRALYKYFLTDSVPGEVVTDTMSLSDPEYRGEMTVEIYASEPVAEANFPNKCRLASVGRIQRTRDNVLIAQRLVYMEIYLGTDSGVVRSSIRKYFEKNR